MRRLKALFLCVVGSLVLTVHGMQTQNKKPIILGTEKNVFCLKAEKYFALKRDANPNIKKQKKDSYLTQMKGAAGISLALSSIPPVAHWLIKNVDLRNRLSFEQLKTIDGSIAGQIVKVSKCVGINPSSLEYMYNDYDPIAMNPIVTSVLHLNYSQIGRMSEAQSEFSIAHELIHFKKLHTIKNWAYLLTAPFVNIPLGFACKYYAKLVDESLFLLQKKFGYENNRYVNKFRSLHTKIMNSPITPIILQFYAFKRMRIAFEKEADIEAARALNSAQGGIDLFYNCWVWFPMNPLKQLIDDHPTHYDRWCYLSTLQKELDLQKSVG